MILFNPLQRMLEKFNISLPSMPTTPPSHEADRSTLLQLAAIIGVAVSSHFSIANPVVAVFALIVYLLKTAIIWSGKNTPHRFVMMLLTIISLGVIVFFYGGWNGQTAGISFLVLLVSLKFLESRSLRDYYIVCIILYFLAASSFLFDSSMLSIGIVVLYTIAITAILFKISNPMPIKALDALKSSTSIIAKSLPLALILFFFFPRISGDFGFLPSQDQSRGNALDDSLIAGEMANSAFNNELAFRVEFDSAAIPNRSQLYWRSKTMPVERDFAWELSLSDLNSVDSRAKQAAAGMDKGTVSYRILHEPSRDLFLPYLDYVAGYSAGKILDDYSVTIRRPQNQSISYSGTSTLAPSLPETSQADNPKFTLTQSRATARLAALLDEFRGQASTKQELVNVVYQYFVENEFKYSLEPPGLDSDNPLDDFIFNTKTGYCEHFASAFTTLMRWLQVPSRVVVGFQGGTLNNAANYLEVRYSDAHAWSEVWVDGRWQRIDPTATVSPERIEFGMRALQELWDRNLFDSDSNLALSNYLNPTGFRRYLRTFNETWKNIGYQWNKWIVNYDKDTQQELLESIGFSGNNSAYTLIGIMMASAGALILFYFWQLIPKVIRRGELQRTYLRFVGKFEKHDIGKELSDTPNEFASKAIAKFPALQQEILSISNTYQKLRYERIEDDSEEQRNQATQLFKRQVKQFKLKV